VIYPGDKGLHGIFFQKHGMHECMFFANVDETHDLDKWKSTTKLLFKFHGCPILWNGKLQLTITLSTMEVEYQALMEATKEVTLLWALLQEFKVDTQGPMVILCDNQSVVKLMKNLVFNARTKHIKLEHHFYSKKG
jgi:hypothetical protein